MPSRFSIAADQHRVLVRRARPGLDPAHRHAELALERSRHQLRLGLAAQHRSAGDEHGKAGETRDARAIAHALERQRGERVAAVLRRIAPDAAAQDHDRLRVRAASRSNGRDVSTNPTRKSATAGIDSASNPTTPARRRDARPSRAPAAGDADPQARHQQGAGRRQHERLQYRLDPNEIDHAHVCTFVARTRVVIKRQSSACEPCGEIRDRRRLVRTSAK